MKIRYDRRGFNRADSRTARCHYIEIYRNLCALVYEFRTFMKRDSGVFTRLITTVAARLKFGYLIRRRKTEKCLEPENCALPFGT